MVIGRILIFEIFFDFLFYIGFVFKRCSVMVNFLFVVCMVVEF